MARATLEEIVFDPGFDTLAEQPTGGSSRYAAYFDVRRVVFCVEQGISIQDEADGLDKECRHFALCMDSRVLSVCRLHPSPPFIKIERVATVKGMRGRGLAFRLMLSVLRECRCVFPTLLPTLHAQLSALHFYETCGFIVVSEEFLDEVNILHRTMIHVPPRNSIGSQRIWEISQDGDNCASSFPGDCHDSSEWSFLPATGVICLLDDVRIGGNLLQLFSSLALLASSSQRSPLSIQYERKRLREWLVHGESPQSYLQSVAWQKLNTGHYADVPAAWRLFFSALHYVLAVQSRGDVRRALRLVDRGLLMGGDLPDKSLSGLGMYLHSQLPPTAPLNFSSLGASRHDSSKLSPSTPVTSTAFFPDPDVFLDQHVVSGIPLLVRHGCGHWPAIEKWSFEWFLAQFGYRTVPIEEGSSYANDDWKQRLRTFREFFQDLVKDGTAPPLYLAQHALFNQLPSLLEDIQVPSLCFSGSSSLSDVDLNIWLGPADTLSPLHTDSRDNIFCQVKGRKRVRLISPSSSSLLAVPSSGILTNTSSLDGETLSTVPILDAIIEPGDLLFIPRLWWHHVRALEPSISVSCWFDQ